ncbi:MAG: hypothetical protein ACP5JP_05275 [bacterium]
MKRFILNSFFIILGVLLTIDVKAHADELIYTAPNYNLVRGTTIGVAPFQNLTSAGDAGDIVSNLIANTFAESRAFRVYGENLFKVRMPSAGLNPSLPVDRSISVKIGQQSGLNYVIFGSVIEYDYQLTPQGTKTLPIVGIDARIVDINSGRIIFAGSFIKEGSPGSPLNEVAAKVVRAIYEKAVR